MSDRESKENFVPVDSREILARVNQMPIQNWNYKTQDKAVRHIGPTAQDFAAAFQVGESERRITTVDADGVALAAIQGLSQIVNEKDAQIRKLQQRLERLEQLLKQPAGGQP
ncbi:MAG: tail fiber domain-containing protein [Verrucomicrobiota bacterium]